MKYETINIVIAIMAYLVLGNLRNRVRSSRKTMKMINVCLVWFTQLGITASNLWGCISSRSIAYISQNVEDTNADTGNPSVGKMKSRIFLVIGFFKGDISFVPKISFANPIDWKIMIISIFQTKNFEKKFILFTLQKRKQVLPVKKYKRPSRNKSILFDYGINRIPINLTS